MFKTLSIKVFSIRKVLRIRIKSVKSWFELLHHRAVVFGSSEARRALGQARVAAPLLGRLGLDGEGMNAGAQLVAQGLVDQAVALQQGQALEARAHHQHPEVRLRARRHSMHVALVQHLQVLRIESLSQFGANGSLDWPTGSSFHEMRWTSGGGESDGGGMDQAPNMGQHQ